MHIYKAIFKSEFIIKSIPPAIRERIITALINLKKPDLFVINVIADENIIRIIAEK